MHLIHFMHLIFFMHIICFMHLRDLVCTFPKTNFNGRVGIIAPYRNQIKALKRSMWLSGLRQDGVEISTVDGFQGR